MRSIKPRNTTRTMTRPVGKSYATMNYMVVLIPEPVRKEQHQEVVDLIKASGPPYKICSHEKRMRTTRIYFEDEMGVFLVKLLNNDIVWKVYQLI